MISCEGSILVDFGDFEHFGENFDGQKSWKLQILRILIRFLVAEWIALGLLQGSKMEYSGGILSNMAEKKAGHRESKREGFVRLRKACQRFCQVTEGLWQSFCQGVTVRKIR